jgi:hypothetical protein
MLVTDHFDAVLSGDAVEERVELVVKTGGDARVHVGDLVLRQQITGFEPLKTIEVLGWKRGPVLKQVDPAMIAPNFDDSKWKPVDDYDVPENSVIVFRAVAEVPAAVASAKGSILAVSSIDDRSTVYVNGVESGKSSQWDQPYRHPIDGKLKPGRNVIAVVVENDGGPGGMANRVEIIPSTFPPDFKSSFAKGVFSKTFTAGGTKFLKEAFVLKSDAAAVFHVEPAKRGAFGGTVEFQAWTDLSRVDDTYLFRGTNQGKTFVVAVRPNPRGGTVSSSERSFGLQGADSGTLILAASVQDGANAAAMAQHAAITAAHRIAKTNYADLKKRASGP